jgi:hypothetical protein
VRAGERFGARIEAKFLRHTPSSAALCALPADAR